MTVTQLMRQRW